MAYATPSDCKSFSALPVVTSKSDAEVQALIDRAELIINAWTRNDFNDAPGLTININGSGSKFLHLPRRIRSLTAVRFLDQPLNQASADFNQPKLTDLFLKGNGWYLEALVFFPTGVENVELDVDGGYSSVPEQVKTATCKVVENLAVKEKDAKTIGGNVKKERIGDYNYELSEGRSSTSLNEAMMAYLDGETRILLRDFKKPMRFRTSRHNPRGGRHSDTHDGRNCR